MKVARFLGYATVLALAAGSFAPARAGTGEDNMTLDLSGLWRFQLDPDGSGEQSAWWAETLDDAIALPGTTDLAGKGAPPEEPAAGRLTRRHAYVGPAWYQREVEIPAAWAGRHIELFLERCHWVSTLWVNGRPAGTQDSLSTPHRYDLSDLLVPGTQTLTLRIDNTLRYSISEFASSITEHSQTNWNGVVGRIELRARPPVRLGRTRIDTAADRRSLTAALRLHNRLAGPAETTVTVELDSPGGGADRPARAVTVTVPPGETELAVTLDLPRAADPWDEFTPTLHRLVVQSVARADGQTWRDRTETRFGFRDFAADGTRFTVNGELIFLRGTLEAALHPATGHPPMDEGRWMEILTRAREHGLNHVRFHAWNPPAAAYAAADTLGVYLQTECPWWGGVHRPGMEEARDFVAREAWRISETYGNHPSFCMFSLGNEIGQPHGEFLSDLVRSLREADPRRLYTTATGPYIPTEFGLGFADDFFVSLATPDGILRGAGRFDAFPPDTTFTYEDALRRIDRPLVVHELGQWAMYPDLAETEKYTGPVWNSDYVHAREGLASRGMLHLNERLTEATGRFLVALYKEEIESVLRTPGVAGYQLLGLTDQTGWGCAVIGVLDAFWESKGLITPEGFRSFSGPIVPLLAMPRRVWRGGDTFTADLMVYNAGPEDLAERPMRWRVSDAEGRELAAGTTPARPVPRGGRTGFGEVSVPLPALPVAERLKFTAQLGGTDGRNSWDFWVFPPPGEFEDGEARVTRDWQEARGALAEGRPVVLEGAGRDGGHTLPGKFTPVFWAFGFNPHGQLGLWVDPAHSALRDFPAGTGSDWHWWELTRDAPAMILEDTPPGFTPIVGVTDNLHRNQKLGAVFEAQVGPGRLVATTFDLSTDLANRPAAAHLRRCLARYAISDDCRPPALDTALVDALLTGYPLDGMVADPPAPDDASLHVVTAVGRTLGPDPTQAGETSYGHEPIALIPLSFEVGAAAESDEVLASAPGFDYTLADMEGRLVQEWLWANHEPRLSLTIPAGFEGTLWLHFSDWNNLNRRTRVILNSATLGDIGRCGGPGEWVAVPLSPRDTAEGRLDVRMRTVTGPNTLLCAFMLTEARRNQTNP